MIAGTLEACNEFLRAYFREHRLRAGLVLEAGSGSFSHFAVPDGARLIALDISLGQLRRSVSPCEKIQGDAQAMPLQDGSVEMAICFNVLEHLERPEAALAELARVLRPGGLLVLGAPERRSLKGLATRLTSVGLHRRYYRHVVKKADRGEGHYDAFPTPFGRIVSAGALARGAPRIGLEILMMRRYDGMREYRLMPRGVAGAIAGALYDGVGALSRVATGGRWDAAASDFLLVARRARRSPPSA